MGRAHVEDRVNRDEEPGVQRTPERVDSASKISLCVFPRDVEIMHSVIVLVVPIEPELENAKQHDRRACEGQRSPAKSGTSGWIVLYLSGVRRLGGRPCGRDHTSRQMSLQPGGTNGALASARRGGRCPPGFQRRSIAPAHSSCQSSHLLHRCPLVVMDSTGMSAHDQTRVTDAWQPATSLEPRSDYDTIAVFCGLQSIGLAAVYWAMRIGFDNPLAPLGKAVALALFMFTFPAISRWLLLRFAAGARALDWWRSYPFLWLFGIAVTAALGRIVPASGLNAFPVLGIIGVAAFGGIFLRWLRNGSVWRSAAIVVGCAAFSVWAAGVVWGLNYKNPLFIENFILNGNVHHDSLHITSFANMLRTYHVASIGIDGLVAVPYHWGTMWLFGQWSNLTGAHLLDFYQLGYPVTMIPFFFGGTLAFAVTLRNRRRAPGAAADLTDDFRFWLVFLAACIGIIPISGLDGMGVWTSNFLISESYTVAVPISLMILATVVVFFDRRGTDASGDTARPRSIGDWLFVLIGIPIAIALLGYLKISFMAL